MPDIRHLLSRLRIGHGSTAQTPSSAWANAICIPSNCADYQILPPVKELKRDTPQISFDDSTLERDLESYIGEDPYPIPATADREGYHGERHYDYWLSGLKDYLLLKRT